MKITKKVLFRNHCTIYNNLILLLFKYEVGMFEKAELNCWSNRYLLRVTFHLEEP